MGAGGFDAGVSYQQTMRYHAPAVKRELAKAYTSLAQLLLGTAIAFSVLNLLLYPVDRALDSDPVTRRYGEELVVASYGGRPAAEVREVLRETWLDRYAYRPFTQYGELPAAGRHLTVDAVGFRHSRDQGPWPPDPEHLNVFLFGGSTLFGYGLPDAETIASHLQPLLSEAAGRPVRCYNFAQGGYYSTQERILFAELLLRGHRPDVALFVDGLNDFALPRPIFTSRLARLFEDRPATLFARLCRHLPALRLASRYREYRQSQSGRGGPLLDPATADPAVLEERIRRYLGNRRLIEALAGGAGVTALFAVQPVPTYNYDLRHHPFAAWGFQDHSTSAFAYQHLARRFAEQPPGENVLWLADMQEGREELLYVDQVHYSGHMCRLIAGEMAGMIRERSLLAGLPEAR